MTRPIRLAVVGIGKIARDQHLPSIARSDAFTLAATVSRMGSVDGIANFDDMAQLLASQVAVDAVALCQPPQARFEAADLALRAGLHVLLEKPPGATVSEARALAQTATQRNLSLFASWHSRMASGVEPARRWLQHRQILGGRVVWREDVRRWHPGQSWIWDPGGLGVFDPGINALAILTHVLPSSISLTRSDLAIPVNKSTPIAASLTFRQGPGALLEVDLDWRARGAQTWDVEIQTDRGWVQLTGGGDRLAIDGAEQKVEHQDEYPALYRRFAELIAANESDVDLRPLEHVADAFMLGRVTDVSPFLD